MTSEENKVLEIEKAINKLRDHEFKIEEKINKETRFAASIKTINDGVFSYVCDYASDDKVIYTALIYATQFDTIPTSNNSNLLDLVNTFNRKIFGAKCVLLNEKERKLRFIFDTTYKENTENEIIKEDILRLIKNTKKTIDYFKSIIKESME